MVVVVTGACLAGEAGGGGAAGLDNGLGAADFDSWGVGTVISGCSAFQSTLGTRINTNSPIILFKPHTLPEGRVSRLVDIALHKHRVRPCLPEFLQ